MTQARIHPRIVDVMHRDGSILETFGARVERAWGGECMMQATVPAALVNAADFAHGAVAFALLDTACAYALGSIDLSGVTLNANTSYVRGARAGSTLTAQVSVVSQTRRIATLRGEVHLLEAHAPVLAAHGTFVFQLLQRRD